MTESETFVFYVVGLLSEIQRVKRKLSSLISFIDEAKLNAAVIQSITEELHKIAKKDEYLRDLLDKEGLVYLGRMYRVSDRSRTVSKINKRKEG